MEQLPAALDELRAFPAPVVDRALLEKVLHIERRTAIRLLHRFGGFQTGKTFLIDRLRFIEQLEQLARGHASGRKVRVDMTPLDKYRLMVTLNSASEEFCTDQDRSLLDRIAARMGQSNLYDPCSRGITSRDVLGLMDLLYGSAGYAETSRKLDLEDGDIVVCWFIDMFDEAVCQENLPKHELLGAYIRARSGSAPSLKRCSERERAILAKLESAILRQLTVSLSGAVPFHWTEGVLMALLDYKYGNAGRDLTVGRLRLGNQNLLDELGYLVVRGHESANIPAELLADICLRAKIAIPGDHPY